MKKKPLKKLPRGEGSMSYVTRRNTEYIYYKKMIGEGKDKKRLAVYGQTQQECMKLMREAEENYKKQVALLNPAQEDNSKNLLADSIQAWLDNVKSKTVKAHSFDIIESTCINHIEKSKLGKMQFSRVTSNDINKLLQSKKEDGYSLSVMERIQSILKQYFAYVYAKDKPNNPMINVKLITKKDYNIQLMKDTDDDDDDIFIETKDGLDINSSKIILTDEEMKKFVSVAGMEYIKGLHGWRHGWGLVFVMYAFPRIGEAIALKWKDISFDKKTVSIYKNIVPIKDRSESKKKIKWVVTMTKTESGARVNLLSNDAIYALQKHFDRISNGRSIEEMQNHYIFETANGGFAKPPNLYSNVKQIIKKAGLSDNKAGLHKLRHTGISYYIRHGVSIDVIAKMAGHSSSQITRKVYYGLVEDQFKDAINIMNNIKQEGVVKWQKDQEEAKQFTKE